MFFVAHVEACSYVARSPQPRLRDPSNGSLLPLGILIHSHFKRFFAMESIGNPGSHNGGTVPYKAIFWVYIPLHSPYIGLKKMVYRYLQWIGSCCMAIDGNSNGCGKAMVKTMVSQGRWSWVFHIFVHLQEGKQLQDLWVPLAMLIWFALRLVCCLWSRTTRHRGEISRRILTGNSHQWGNAN